MYIIMHDNYLINLNKRTICFIFSFNKNTKIYEYYMNNIKRLILNINFYIVLLFYNFYIYFNLIIYILIYIYI